MTDNGNRYALHALRNKRAQLAAEIVDLERQIRHRKDSLVHVDYTLKLLDPNINVVEIPHKRIIKRVKLFRQGELGRLILGAIRKSEGVPISTYDIVSAIIEAGGHGEEVRPTVAPRVRGNLVYLHTRKMVEKAIVGRETVWVLAAQSVRINQ